MVLENLTGTSTDLPLYVSVFNVNLIQSEPSWKASYIGCMGVWNDQYTPAVGYMEVVPDSNTPANNPGTYSSPVLEQPHTQISGDATVVLLHCFTFYCESLAASI